MPVVMVDHVRTPDHCRELGLGPRVDESVVVGPQDRRGYVDVTDPRTRVEPPDTARGFGEHPDVVATHLVGRPLEETCGPMCVHTSEQSGPGRRNGGEPMTRQERAGRLLLPN